MWPATDLRDVFNRSSTAARSSDALGQRLVSLVFAPPGAPLWKELDYTVGYLDALTGDAWDLFFIGVPAVARRDLSPQGAQHYDWSRFFDPDKFAEVAAEVTHEHASALTSAGRKGSQAWRHTGGVDLVSLMAYAGSPDWLSLTSTRVDERGPRGHLPLSEIAARHARWEEGEIDEEFSPGLPPEFGRGSIWGATLPGLTHALRATALTLGGGVAGNAAYELIRTIKI